MARFIFHLYFFAFMVFASPSAATSQVETFELGKSSEVQFRVGILGVFKKSGTFSDVRGTLTVGVKSAKVSAVIGVRSAKMARKADVKLLLSEAYFNAKSFPEIRFESEQFSPNLLKVGGMIRGAITVRGITRQQSFVISTDPACTKEAKFVLDVLPRQINLRCPFHAKGSLQRAEFGMNARKAFVSDKVELDLLFFAQP
jgi:polyisoprenoid-binding protein YceI